MSDELPERGEDLIDESGRNPTQRRIDEGDETGAVDAPWDRVPGENESELPIRDSED